MLIAGFPAGPWGTNCYVAATGPGTECVVIDPGKDAADGVAEVVRQHNLKPVAVLVTHGHVDHMWCVAPVSGTYDATAWIHPRDRHLLSDPMAGMTAETSAMLGGKYEFVEPDRVEELADADAVMRAVDKLDKLSEEQVGAMLVEDTGVSDEQAQSCLALARISTSDSSFVEQVRALGVQHELLDEGLAELAAVMEGCAPLVTDRVEIVADLKIARGLDYYTGTVFETRLHGYDGLGSICSGGRYDALATDGPTTYPGVGISLGVSRLLVPLLGMGVVEADRSVPSAVLVAVVDEEHRTASDLLAEQLRGNGVACEVAPAAQKFGKQIRYAERRGIPYVLFPGAEGEPAEIKDIRSGEQTAVDLTTWTPPVEDLRPAVRRNEQEQP